MKQKTKRMLRGGAPERWLSASLLVLTMLCAGPAVAATSMQLRTPVVIGKHYEQNGFASCTESSGCNLVFAPAPSGKNLTILRVACHIGTSPVPPSEITLLEATPIDAFARPQPMVPSLVSSSASSSTNPRSHYSLLHETSYPVTGSPKVRVFLPTNGSGRSISFFCQIAGQLAP
jgi:hypothetical protein